MATLMILSCVCQERQTIIFKMTITINLSGLLFCGEKLDGTFLLLNSVKTKMLAISPAGHRYQFHQDSNLTLDNCDFSKFTCREKSWILCFDQHIKEITQVAYFHMCNIAKIRSFLSLANTKILIHAFVSSILDYCNALLFGLLCAIT